MRVFAKKAFKLEVGGVGVTTRPLAFADIPDALADTLIFKLAVKDGDIEVITTPEKQKVLESDPGKPSRGKRRDGKGAEPPSVDEKDGDPE